MKKTAVLLIIAFVAFSCKEKKEQAAPEGYRISGTVKGMSSGEITISEYRFFEQKGAPIYDSAKIVDGKFSMEGKVEFPDMVFVQIGDFNGTFFLENSEIELNFDVSELSERNPRMEPEVKGSKSHAEYKTQYEKSRAPFSNPKYKVLDEVRELYATAKKSGKEADKEAAIKRQQELGPVYEEQIGEYNNNIYSYVRQNPSSPIAVHIMGVNYTEGRMTRELLKEFYGVFQGDARKTGFFKFFITKIYKDNFETVGIGNTAPDFTLETVDGEQLTMTEVDAKYMLIDFWASWCVPCRASFPHLKELRKMYGSKGFKILGVGTADEEAKWRIAIEEDQTPWMHVFDVSDKNQYGPVAKSYGVPHLPTTLLVDANRKIILRNPTKEELDAKLAEVFNK